MVCTACGKANLDNAAFCEQCGTRMQAQPATSPGAAAPGPAPAPPFAFPVPQGAPPPGAPANQMGALIASMSMGEKISGGGAAAAAVGFFLPWMSIAVAGVKTGVSGMDIAKSSGATYFIILNVIGAGVLCYLSSQAPPAKKLLYAGYLVLLGAVCGPALLLSLLFVSQLSSVAEFGLWLVGLGYCAIAEGGLMTIREFSKRTY